MLSFIRNLFDFHRKEITRIRSSYIDKINALEDEVRALPEAAFALKTAELKELVASGQKSLEDVLPLAFALVREAARRTLKQRHYDVQLIGGVALHEGKVIEQRTGEGKTLTATSALYLNALTGQGVHLVTVNDYLARRDAGWMGAVFHLLGMSTSAVISEDKSYIYDPKYIASDAGDFRLTHLRPVDKKEAYKADITYGVNSEFGFDYLRDNRAGSKQELVQRGFYFAIVDEADSVLIDEARTPHIMSAPSGENTQKYYEYAAIVNKLDGAKDFIIDEKLRSAHLTEEGMMHIEKLLGVDNVYEKDFDTLFHVEAALKAQTLFKKDKEYIVRDNQIVIVDEFTGRLLEGRRFSEGIHQAIEAKEGVSIQQESVTLATVSLQNYFRLYKKLAGMTGTAATEAEEFHKIYKTDVLVIPTHRANIRRDHADRIYKTEKAKLNAVVDEATQQSLLGRPVLIGTTSIEKNEYISQLLHRKNVKHQLLNAKNHEREAHIIAQAGKKGAVTVATNMAGRGVDIILGGDIQREYFESDKDYQNALKGWQAEHDEVVSLGGLSVIGTERHESRRIDNQLRGRAGRQGDPGETCFFVSLQDDVMRIFGGEQIARVMGMLNFPEDQPLSHPMVTRAIEQAQVKVEGFHFDSRKHLVEQDDVLNKHREIVYALRRKILLYPEEQPEEFRQTVLDTIHEQIHTMTTNFFVLRDADPPSAEHVGQDMAQLFQLNQQDIDKLLALTEDDFSSALFEKAVAKYKRMEDALTQFHWSEHVRIMYLSTIDQFWTQHLTSIEDLRQGIGLRGYAQLDPLVEYKNEAYTLFEAMLQNIHYEAVRRIMRVEIRDADEEAELPIPEKKPIQIQYQAAAGSPITNTDSDNKKLNSTPQRVYGQKKLHRNDPCWCGSGKKWKKCHYPATQ